MAKPIPTPIPDDVKARFWAKVDVRGPDECWEWKGGKGSTRSAYGRFTTLRGLMRPAHQVSWEIHHGVPFPEGKIGCHSCDNPPCVNPAHIWPGTVSENARDAVAKGRWPMKPKSHCARGHAMEGENRVLIPDGGSRCRECRRIMTRERTRRFRERARANG